MADLTRNLAFTAMVSVALSGSVLLSAFLRSAQSQSAVADRTVTPRTAEALPADLPSPATKQQDPEREPVLSSEQTTKGRDPTYAQTSQGDRPARRKGTKGIFQEGVAVFRQQIRPILTSICLNCHGPDKRKGGVHLSHRDAALESGVLVPGNPAESLLYEMVATGQMPRPPYGPLSPQQIAAFWQWIELGAPYQREPLTANAKPFLASW